MTQDEQYMSLALSLARLGSRKVAPNPMVGAVIVKDWGVIGKGYHKQFGEPHAEVNAINSVKNKQDLVGATIYVTLEPCRHHGKTPPCFDLIKKVGIMRIVCGSKDLFKKTGNRTQETARMEFLKGGVAKECETLNKFFFTWVTKKRPFITVKVAITADGYVAGEGSSSIRITTPSQDKEVDQMRAGHQAILVGSNTALNDNPSLTVRSGDGPDPLRIVIDSKLRVPKTFKVFKDENYLIATTSDITNYELRITSNNIWKSPTKKQVCLRRLFKHLASIGISSVLVEPGPTLYAALKKQKLIDELIVFKGKKKIGKGLSLKL